MEQKPTWRHYIFIGIAISLLLTISCGRKLTDWIQHAEYQYVNQTNYNITFPKGAVNVIVRPNTITTFKMTFGANEIVTANSFANDGNPFDLTDTYKRIFFDNLKCLDLSTLTINNPSNFKNYVAERIDKRTFKFTYTFTEADYNRAVTCP